MTIPRFDYPKRVTVGLLLILLFAALSNMQLLRTALSMRVGGDTVTAYETRLERLKASLPRRGVVGYIADPKRADVRWDAEYYKRYLLTQYSLSPILVVDNTKPELVVGNFHRADSNVNLSVPDLRLLHDFGNGVALFANNSR